MNNLTNLNFITRITEHHIERHYETDTNKNYFLQHIYVSDEFYENRFMHCLGMQRSIELKNLLLDDYGSHNSYQDFEYLNNSTFTSFFRENSVDIPRCFQRTVSVRRAVNEVNLLKFNNYFMRHGKRWNFFTFLSKSINTEFYNPLTLDDRWSTVNFSWKSIFLILNFALKSKPETYMIPSISKESVNYNHLITGTHKLISTEWDYNDWFFRYIRKMLPMFSFYIYKVDKKIFKNTRGKSGKFTFIWKYVTPYKRVFLVMHWLMKELKVRPGRNLSERLGSLVRDITNSPKNTWVFKVKNFSYNYVYRNARKTLAENYRTVTK